LEELKHKITYLKKKTTLNINFSLATHCPAPSLLSPTEFSLVSPCSSPYRRWIFSPFLVSTGPQVLTFETQLVWPEKERMF
jgi:hypothetical protein